MWRKAGPVVTAVLAIGLILTMRRLSDAQVELERMRGQMGDGRAELAGSSFRSLDAAALASEWEQAVLPMDS